MTELDRILHNTKIYIHEHGSIARPKTSEYVKVSDVTLIGNEARRLQNLVIKLKKHCIETGTAEYDSDGAFHLKEVEKSS